MRKANNAITGAPREGVLVIDKPAGMTSHDVVDRLRRLTGVRRIGHTGTLDPFATGVLVLCVGRATKIAGFLTSLDKEYEGEMTLGAVSSTYDVEGEKTYVSDGAGIDRARVEDAIGRFVGTIVQTPPSYSAVKVRGKRLYEYAREGRAMQAKPRRVTVYDFSILSFAPPTVRFQARVSSGTYVRSLCHDVGHALGCGAYVSALRRTRVGHFGIEDAMRLEEIESRPERVSDLVIALRRALVHLPQVCIKSASLDRVRTGRSLSREDLAAGGDEIADQQAVVIYDEHDEVLAVYGACAEAQSSGGGERLVLRPVRVLIS